MGQIAACVDVGAGSGFKASGRHQCDFALCWFATACGDRKWKNMILNSKGFIDDRTAN